MIEPVRRTIHVTVAPEAAFRRFTAGIDTWWPRATHSVSGERCAEVRLEGRAGGRLYEVAEGGAEEDWGRVLTWSPPAEVSFTWHPGMATSDRQVVRVRFEPDGAGTLVHLEHRGWEAYGDRATEMRANYDRGWAGVLALYGECLAGEPVRT